MGPAVIFTSLCDGGGQCSKGSFLWLLQFAIARCDTQNGKRKEENTRKAGFFFGLSGDSAPFRGRGLILALQLGGKTFTNSISHIFQRHKYRRNKKGPYLGIRFYSGNRLWNLALCHRAGMCKSAGGMAGYMTSASGIRGGGKL